MDDCKGLFGKIFGHSFTSYHKKSEYEPVVIETYAHEIERDIFLRHLKIMGEHYEIRCKRCGAKPKDEDIK